MHRDGLVWFCAICPPPSPPHNKSRQGCGLLVLSTAFSVEHCAHPATRRFGAAPAAASVLYSQTPAHFPHGTRCSWLYVAGPSTHNTNWCVAGELMQEHVPWLLYYYSEMASQPGRASRAAHTFELADAHLPTGCDGEAIGAPLICGRGVRVLSFEFSRSFTRVHFEVARTNPRITHAPRLEHTSRVEPQGCIV